MQNSPDDFVNFMDYKPRLKKILMKILSLLLKAGITGLLLRLLHSHLIDLPPRKAVITAFTASFAMVIVLRLAERTRVGLRSVLGLLAVSCIAVIIVMPSSFRTFIPDGWRFLLATPIVLHLVWGMAEATFAWRTDSSAPKKKLENALSHVVPRNLARLAATELHILANAFLWLAPQDVPSGVKSFSYHRLVAPIMWAFFCLALIEAMGIHLLLGLWQPKLGWALLAISDFSLLYLLGLICSLRRMPVTLDDHEVRIRAGLLYDFRVPLTSILNVSTAISSAQIKQAGTLKTSLMTFPNIMFEIAPPIPSPKPMGLGGPVNRVAIALDDRDAFIRDLRSRALSISSD